MQVIAEVRGYSYGCSDGAMSVPQIGDILIRNLGTDRFVLVDAVTGKHLAGPVKGFAVAVTIAQQRGARAIWQQNTDERGRPLGDPFKLPA